jgi:hypothetical protein
MSAVVIDDKLGSVVVLVVVVQLPRSNSSAGFVKAPSLHLFSALLHPHNPWQSLAHSI